MVRIRVTTRINPTEDIIKVKQAVRNIFDGELTVIKENGEAIRIEGFSTKLSSLGKLYNLVRIEQIIPATRSYLIKGIHGNTISFMLHKQAAFAGKISFVDGDNESPLGAIKFIIETDDPMRIIDWLAPSRYTSNERRMKPGENEV
jgi:predicted RNA binding protein with dsRBD fold (UPF0201 family)